MKTAEEWIKYLDPNTSSESCCYSPVPIEDIKQIQLDAMKEGMRRAADFIINWCPSTQKPGGAACISCKELSKAILTDANNRTELP